MYYSCVPLGMNFMPTMVAYPQLQNPYSFMVFSQPASVNQETFNNFLQSTPQNNSLPLSPETDVAKNVPEPAQRLDSSTELQFKKPEKRLKKGHQKSLEYEPITRKPVKIWKNSLLSFICNKILKFIMSNGQSSSIVSKLIELEGTPGASLEDFYHYTSRVCSKLVNKVSIQKMRDLWVGQHAPNEAGTSTKLNLYHKIFRVLSSYYLDNIAPSYLLLSKKCKKHQLSSHLKMRKWLIGKLRYPGLFRCYKDLEM